MAAPAALLGRPRLSSLCLTANQQGGGEGARIGAAVCHGAPLRSTPPGEYWLASYVGHKHQQRAEELLLSEILLINFIHCWGTLRFIIKHCADITLCWMLLANASQHNK